jgi:hypothetical protein
MAKVNRFVEEVRAKNAPAQGEVQRCRVADTARLAQMPQHPSSLFRRRLISIERMKNIEISYPAYVSMAKIQIAAQPRLEGLLGNADKLRPRKSSDDVTMVGRILAKRARFEDGCHQCEMFRRALLDKVSARHQDFLGMTGRQLGARRNAPTGAGLRGNGIPRFADAKSIEMAGLEIGHHLRRRDDNDADVPVRLDSGGVEPGAQ